jgi:carbon storage regulator
MLVLTRKIDESIVIDDRIVVTVLGIEGDKVKIGISAPREVPILRQELWQAVADQNRIAEALANVLSSGSEPGSFQELRELLAEETPGQQDAANPAGEPPVTGQTPEAGQTAGQQPVVSESA